MTGISQWAARWQLPPQCVQELLAVMGAAVPQPAAQQHTGKSEAAVQNEVRIAAAKRGVRLFRNNVGVATGENGVPVRYGLANDSKQMNAVCKSSDLIGITPVTCGCGHTYGVFTSFECKKNSWKFSQNDARAVAQFNWLKFVNSMGGIGKFINSLEQL